MLTESQIRETAVRMVAEEIRTIGGYDKPDADKNLCRDHCGAGECNRDPGDVVEEIRAVHDAIDALGRDLRMALADAASRWGLPSNVVEVPR